jgi:hypothetical protein
MGINVKVAKTDEEILEALPSAINGCIAVLTLAKQRGTKKQIERQQKKLYTLSYRYVKLCDKLNKHVTAKNLMMFKI